MAIKEFRASGSISLALVKSNDVCFALFLLSGSKSIFGSGGAWTVLTLSAPPAASSFSFFSFY